MVGLAAGTITTLGFAFLSPLLEEKTGLGDTCGVHNLHGMPGLLGGLVRQGYLQSWSRVFPRVHVGCRSASGPGF